MAGLLETMFPRSKQLPPWKEQQAQRLSCGSREAALAWNSVCSPEIARDPGWDGRGLFNLIGSHSCRPMNRKSPFTPWLTPAGVQLLGRPSCVLTCCGPWLARSLLQASRTFPAQPGHSEHHVCLWARRRGLRGPVREGGPGANIQGPAWKVPGPEGLQSEQAQRRQRGRRRSPPGQCRPRK